MTMKSVNEVEQYVAAVLRDQLNPLSINEVVGDARLAIQGMSVAQVKVATLNLVSQGRAKLDDAWRVTAIPVQE